MDAAPTRIRVPKPHANAFNKDRRLSKNALLMGQVRHFKELEKKMPLKQRTGIALKAIKTEGDAANYIRKMTAILHPQAAGGGAK